MMMITIFLGKDTEKREKWIMYVNIFFRCASIPRINSGQVHRTLGHNFKLWQKEPCLYQLWSQTVSKWFEIVIMIIIKVFIIIVNVICSGRTIEDSVRSSGAEIEGGVSLPIHLHWSMTMTMMMLMMTMMMMMMTMMIMMSTKVMILK